MLPTKIWNRYFILIMFFSIASGIVGQVFGTITSRYVVNLGGSQTQAGAVVFIATIATLIASLLSGWLVDTYGRRIVLLTGYVIMLAATALFRFFPFIAAFCVLRIIQAAGMSASGAAGGTAYVDVTPAARLGEAAGYFGLVQSFTTAFGPMIGLGLILKTAQGENYDLIFGVSALFVALALLAGLFLTYEKRGFGNPRTAPEGEQEKPRGLRRFIEPKALPASVVQFWFFTGCAFNVSFLSLYADAHGIANISWFYTTSAVGMFLTRLLAGRLSDRHGTLPVLLVGFAIGIASFALHLVAPYWQPFVYISGFIYGLALGLITPALNAAAVRASPANRRGAAMATYSLSISVGLGIGALFFGWTSDMFGYTATLCLSMLLAVVSMILSVVFFRGHHARQPALDAES